MTEAGMMHIGELAERTELSLRTIRHYDEIGLLRPSGRSEGGFRLYTEADLERLLLIRRMKPLGFSLDEMARLLEIIAAQSATPADVAEMAELQHFITETRSRREKLQQQLDMADEFLERLKRL